jgi:hypothetical protein
MAQDARVHLTVISHPDEYISIPLTRHLPCRRHMRRSINWVYHEMCAEEQPPGLLCLAPRRLLMLPAILPHSRNHFVSVLNFYRMRLKVDEFKT